MKKVVLALLTLGIAIALVAIYWFYREERPRDHLLLFGNVDVRQVDLGFRVSGRVQTLFYEEGDLVTEGVLLAVLDKQPYEDLIRQSEATLNSTIASLRNAEQQLERRKQLISDGSISQEDLDTAMTNQKVFAANKVESEAALAVAKVNFQFTELYSPTEGTILTRIREPGTVVNPADPVYTLSVSDPIWIRAFINEPELGLVFPGMPAEIYTDIIGGKVYHGRVGFISPVAEFTPKTVETTQLRTDLVYRIRIYAANPDKGLRQGMPVTVKLNLNKGKQ